MKLSAFLLFDTARSVDPISRGLEITTAADELGLHAVWCAEHHFGPFGGLPNPAVFLAAAAARTKRVRLGPAVAVLPLRHPALVAEDYALVDRLSDGRLVMGVGSGAIEREFEDLGIPFSMKRELFETRLRVFRSMWNNPEETRLSPGFVKTGRAIHVATNREDAAYRVGKEGDGLLTLASPHLEDLEPVRLRLEAHRRGATDAGHTKELPRVVVMLGHVAETTSKAEAEAAGPVSEFGERFEIPGVTSNRTLYELMRQRRTGAFGSPQEVADQIDRVAGFGATEIALWCCFGDMPAAVVIGSMGLLTKRVRPLLRKATP